MAALNLLEGRLLTFGSRPDLAEVQLRAAFRKFLKRGLHYDAALAAFAMAVLFIHTKRDAELFSSMESMTDALLGMELVAEYVEVARGRAEKDPIPKLRSIYPLA